MSRPIDWDGDDKRRLRERIRGVMMAAYLQARYGADACQVTEGALPRGCPLDPYPSDAGHGLGGLQTALGDPGKAADRAERRL